MQAAGVTAQQLQMVLQQRLALPSVVRSISATGTAQSPSRLPNVAIHGSAVASGARPSFVAAFSKTLSTSSNLTAFKAPLPPVYTAPLPKAEKRKYEALRLVLTHL